MGLDLACTVSGTPATRLRQRIDATVLEQSEIVLLSTVHTHWPWQQQKMKGLRTTLDLQH
jgi:hypothetical protein